MGSSCCGGRGRCWRRGSGKLRHVKVSMLWVQGKREEGTLEYSKVGGEYGPADLMTKHLNSEAMRKHAGNLIMKITGGRADEGLQLSTLRQARSRRRKRKRDEEEIPRRP